MHEHIIPRKEQRIAGRFVRATMFRRRKARAWPIPEHLVHETTWFEGNAGGQLPGIHFPTPNAKGIVVLAHPDRRYGKHWFIREGWIEWLHEHGYAAFVFDFSQYGQSKTGSTYLYQDVLFAIEEARRLAPGLPVHVIGLSLGAFAAAVASPYMHNVRSLILESPYPDFGSWYQNAEGEMKDKYNGTHGHFAMRAFNRMFPNTARIIHADRQIEAASPTIKRILIVGSHADDVTALHLTRQVASAAPPERTIYQEYDDVAHLGFFATQAGHRDQMIEMLEGRPSPSHGIARAPASAAAAVLHSC